MADKKIDGFAQSYSLTSLDHTKALYADWSSNYDEQLSDTGYVTPERCAAALAKFSPHKSAPVLDFGCGTGLSAAALRDAGFTTIDGTDLSAEMIAVAETKQLYRQLWVSEADTSLAFATGTYAAITAVGVFTPGHAPGRVMAQIMDRLAPGGLFVFSFNDHSMADPDLTEALADLIAQPFVALRHDEYGDHLPGIDLKAKIYVLERTDG